jgi:hypothetical protein
MADTLDGVWLFTRGGDSVLITRTAEAGGRIRVVVDGPGPATATHLCVTLADCIRLQQQLDSELMAQGFRVSRSPERRVRPERRSRARGRGRRR